MIRVAIADDHNLVREGIRALLERSGDIDVVGEAVDGEEAVDLVRRLAPDVLVLDIAMPRLNGIQALGQLRALGLPTQVVVLSMYSDEANVRQALHEGARGFLLKGAVSEELLLAVRAAARGATYLSPAISGALLPSPAGPSPDAPVTDPGRQLTPREREVLQLVGKGLTSAEIAAQLGISVKTVERHRTNLMSKLGAHSLVELMRIGIKQGLIRLDE